ncbi:MAG: glycosyltransferase family 2 protein [Deltaproteobacteria bacterium]|nr:glycosyltransferase family 2 protein [Deltaproteobacteria bacterium]
MSKTRCIIIPAFNEGEQIASVIDGIRRFTDADIVVVDDGSRDQTGEKARRAGAYVIEHPFNIGYGAALQTGYRYALNRGYSYLLQMDGDGQHDPGSIPGLFREAESGGWDVVLGSRFLGREPYRAGPLKDSGILVFRILVRLLTGQTITDPTSGYQCLGRRVFEVFAESDFPWRYPDANIILQLHLMGFRIKEVPARMVPNPSGRSMHQGVFRLVYYFFEMFLSLFVTLLRERNEGLAGNRVSRRAHKEPEG